MTKNGVGGPCPYVQLYVAYSNIKGISYISYGKGDQAWRSAQTSAWCQLDIGGGGGGMYFWRVPV